MSAQAGVAGLTVVAAFGSALVAGVMFAFSTFVMAGLGRVGPEHGMRAMQGINEAAVTAPFMILLFGTAAAALGLGAVTLFSDWSLMGRNWLLAGVGLYFFGVVLVTIIGNVPMNEALARKSAMESPGQAYWATYLSHWTLLNHVRTLAAAAASIAFAIARFGT